MSARTRQPALLPDDPTLEEQRADLDRQIAAEPRRLLSTSSLSIQQVKALKFDVHANMVRLQAARRRVQRRIEKRDDDARESAK